MLLNEVVGSLSTSVIENDEDSYRVEFGVGGISISVTFYADAEDGVWKMWFNESDHSDSDLDINMLGREDLMDFFNTYKQVVYNFIKLHPDCTRIISANSQVGSFPNLYVKMIHHLEIPGWNALADNGKGFMFYKL